MNLRNLPVSWSLFLAAAIPALAGTVVTSPTKGEQVGSPFTLNMSADICASKPVTEVGYSLDSSSSTATFAGQKMDGPVDSPSGWHTVHIKVWNDVGGICVTDVSIDVTGAAGAGALAVVPASSTRVGSIQTLSSWTQIHDGGTPGTSSGWTGLQYAPTITGTSREFATNFSYFGGQRYSVQFDDNTTAQNFLYDAWVYIAGSSAGFSNLEFDLSQTMSNGETVIMGFQCDSWINRWDYTINGGSSTKPWDTWQHSGATCDVHNWAVNRWHHVQIYSSHNESGWVTYHSVWLDGVEQGLNATVFSGFELGWGPAIVTNFQIDGASSGSSYGQVYLDEMTVSRW